MSYYPIYLDLRGRLCVVFGGGEAAAEKVRSLLDAGARVRVVAPALNDELRALGRHFEYVPRAYQPGDLRDVFLAFSEWLDEADAIFQEAEARGVPVHIQDNAARSSFADVPVVRRGDLPGATLTGSKATGGKAPAPTPPICGRAHEPSSPLPRQAAEL